MSLDTPGQQQVGSGGALGDSSTRRTRWCSTTRATSSAVSRRLAEARMAGNVEMFLARALAVVSSRV